jgi:hypothetical protein
MFVHAAAAALLATALLTGGWPAATRAAAADRRQSPPETPARSSSLSGTVTTDADRTPLPRARVVIQGAGTAARAALADARGAFRIDGLPAGDFTVAVHRTGYVLPHASGGPIKGVTVRLGAAESRAGLSLVLQRAGTIPGRLLDEDGTPLAGADVEALSLRVESGEPLQATASARTDDRGEFRLTGLPAGQYFVAARDAAFTDVSDAAGELRYASTYYPGVFSSAEARAVTVAAGQDAAGIEFRLQIVRPARISGVIATPERQPLLSGAFLLTSRDGLATRPFPPGDVDFFPDGRFSLRNVPPGRYQLRARGELDPRQAMWFSSYNLTVEGHDLDDVSLVLVPGAMVRGRIEWRQGTAARPPSYAGIRIRAPLADGTSFGDTLTGLVAADGTFDIRGIMPGSHFFTVEGIPEPWAVASIVAGGTDVLDRATALQEGERLENLRITLSAESAALEGTVRTAAGAPAGDTLVVTVAAPPALASPASPRFRSTRTDRAGRYRLAGLPAGEYRVAAVSGMDELVGRRLDGLTRLGAAGSPVTLPGSGQRTLDLQALTLDALSPAGVR